jgi:N-acylneuraminate cytidylyltransferase
VRLALIPARGGSKRIPGKNIRAFAGKPIIGWSIECALASGLFERVVVSTDDEAIARVARDFGAETPFLRPAALSDDHADTTSVVAHAVEALQAGACSAVCCIYATAPFMRVEDLRRGAQLLDEGRWQYVFAATSYDAPVFRGFTEAEEGGLRMLFPEHFGSRSQDLPEALHDAAQFYFGRPAAWRDRARIFDAHSTVVRIPRERVQDIDTEEDWRLAEALVARLAALPGDRRY